MDGSDFDLHEGEFSVPTGDFADIPGNTSTPATMVPGSTYSDTLETVGDVDYIRISLTAGQAYNFNIQGNGGTPLSDSILEVRDASGNLLQLNDDYGGSLLSRIGFVPTTSGTYYLSVRGYNGTTGGYNLNASAASTALPVYSSNQVANYLTDTYWTDTGRARHAFNTATVTVNMTGLAANAQSLATNALRLWSQMTGLVFQTTAGAAQITMDDNNSGATTSFTATGNVTNTATINIGTSWLGTYGTAINGYSFQTYLHEIGHALGLGHAGNYNGSANYRVSTAFTGSNHFLNDSWQQTVMSYFDQNENTTVDATRAYVVGPMIADIIAIQNLYGTPTNTRTGDTTYGFNNTADAIYNFANYTQGADSTQAAPRMVAFAIFDSSGNDTLDASGFTVNQMINLAPGAYSNIGGQIGNIGIATNTFVENAVGGSGNDTIYGSGIANTLRAGNGADFIQGNGGADVIFGGDGFDTVSYFYGTGSYFDLTTGYVSDGEGSTDAVDQVEQFMGSGYYRDIFIGNAQVNYFAAGGGNDYVIAGDAGADVFNGGDGFDTIGYYNSFGVYVNLLNNTAVDGSTGFQQGSTDTIVNFEEVYGSANYADVIIGNNASNVIWGFGGADLLVGLQGYDVLNGGAGNDYFGFNLSDFQSGIWDLVADFHEAPGDTDILYFAGVNPSQVIFGEANGGVYVSVASIGGTGGFFVAGATMLSISDQLVFA